LYDKNDTAYEPLQTRNSATGELENVVYSYIIPDLSADLYRKASIKGMLDIQISGGFAFIPLLSKQGTIRFEIYMYDRDLIQSNIITTPDISIR